MKRPFSIYAFIVGLIAWTGSLAFAQAEGGIETWQLEEPRPEKNVMSPDGLTLLQWDSLPTIPREWMQRPWVGLAGLQIDREWASLRKVKLNVNLRLIDLKAGSTTLLKGDRGHYLRRALFSPDSRWLALVMDSLRGGELLLVEVKTGAVRVRHALAFNDVLGEGLVWSPDGATLYVRGTRAPPGFTLPAQPLVLARESSSERERERARPYSYLLQSKEDEEVFQRYASGRWLALGLDGIKKEVAAWTGPVANLRFSRDGQYVAVDSLSLPLNRNLPAHLMPIDTKIWKRLGSAERWGELALSPPVREHFSHQRRSNRAWYWNPARGHEMLLVDKDLQTWDLATSPKSLLSLQRKPLGIIFLSDASGFLIQYLDTQTQKAWVDLARPDSEAKTLYHQDLSNKADHPGKLVEDVSAIGEFTAFTKNGSVYLSGSTFDPMTGESPYLQELHLDDGTKTKVIEGTKEQSIIEDFVGFVGRDPRQLLLSQESPRHSPVLITWDRLASSRRRLTSPAFDNALEERIQRRTLHYKRDDGVQLSASLILPKPTTKALPLIFWAYPEEHSEIVSAEDVKITPKRFLLPKSTSPEWLSLQGYAVIYNAPMPILSREGQAPVSPVDQMQSNIAAAIAPLIREGVVDPERVAIAGHSFGANMVAQLVTKYHNYCSGLAMSGAYNRTLTPFGYQSEKRNLWVAKEDYLSQSPLLSATTIETPLLLLHGQDDTNPGTPVLQSERMFQALLGLGKPARLVIFPGESHELRGREAVARSQEELLLWLQRYCSGRQVTSTPLQTSSARSSLSSMGKGPRHDSNGNRSIRKS